MHKSGFQAFLVGGGVRDLLLGREPKDFDVVTDAEPEEVKRVFRNSRLIGRRFRLAHVRFGPEIIEVATFRSAVDDADVKKHSAKLIGAELAAADCRFVDGTFFTPGELLALRPGAADAHAMGHLPIGGEGGSLEILSGMPGKSIYIHINNTNPMLDANSPEAALVRERGLSIAHDGMEFEL